MAGNPADFNTVYLHVSDDLDIFGEYKKYKASDQVNFLRRGVPFGPLTAEAKNSQQTYEQI
jgi:hypothetical protein